MTSSLIDNNDAIMSERRQYKRCPKCQFLFISIVILLSSVALLFLFNVLPQLTDKRDFQVVSASSYQLKNTIAIDADLQMLFPDVVVEALENGIPLTIAVEVQVLRERPWWRNLIIKSSIQLFELRYHPLTNVHEVKNIATDERYSFNSRQDAMAVLGTIRGAFLIEQKELNKNRQYSVQMRILLDISHLPAALRQVASLSSSWRLESTWYRWQISKQPKAQETVDNKIDSIPQLGKQNALSERILDRDSNNDTISTGEPMGEIKEQDK
ncbi:MAG: DUF4390 domain-containing protein [gamma proteobacterium symbiont of Bathyaustriella thionipta]|nr:DUF4390 domain-containing protein [gamma proteobacterium symbiont of Bathyaustriella thionipta]MCU7948743.1 DUF4390 domain-containing protein [gamma proteobacterium symbiont of Bathyaustriella thionipta]MCU7953561.1 DUF4390 domain-containing protein [gamma proteobacterium symbiont of Bathyaustriella thionipta]MCU7955226.1 DUF4390 domain-containing protein [gamma proteobacterium symbiont of Bathyaustriella thionipta]MCU7967038.1 DUF4390 domain-containing protein [gamma proteobacterium symbion